MAFFPLSLLLAVCIVACGWECGVTGDWEAEHMIPDNVRMTAAMNRGEELNGIRMQGYFLGDSQSALWESLKSEAVPSVLAWFRSVLRVLPLRESIVLPTDRCGPGVSVPAAHHTAGVSDCDFLLYIVPMNLSEAGSQKAAGRGMACVLEGGGSRGSPLAGTVWVNEKILATMDRQGREDVLRHQVAHVLAMSGVLMQRYRQPDGSLHLDPLTSSPYHSRPTPFLSTPLVQSSARTHFSCASLPGLPLLTSASGLVDPHWSARTMLTDFLVRNPANETTYSSLSLAVFQDSGWYVVDFRYATRMEFGKKKGCDFVFGDCVKRGGKAKFSEFCVQNGSDLCDFSKTRKATCGLKRYKKPLPSDFRWFSDPNLGGVNPDADYCPYNVPDLDGDCRGLSATPPVINDIAYGEESCPECRCFIGTYVSTHWADRSLPTHSGCHRVVCKGGTAVVMLGKVAVECPKRGGVVGGVAGFEGNITCPSFDSLCVDRLCVHNCYGFGRCVEGVCECQNGHFGVDCGQQCNERCAKCSDYGDNHCLECYQHAELKDGTCQCEDGFVYESGLGGCVWDRFRCEEHCKSCVGPGTTQCVECYDNAVLDETSACSCAPSFYWASGQCTPCPPTCLDCTSPSDCLNCAPNAHLAGSTGTCVCDSQYFYSEEGMGCRECHRTCGDCGDGSETGCVRCRTEMAEVRDGRCVCVEGYYLRAEGDQCEVCSPTCWTCVGPSQFDCLTCATHATLLRGECQCADGYQLSPDLLSCIPQPITSPCITDYTPISTVLVLFVLSLFTAKKLVDGEKRYENPPQNRESRGLTTELSEIQAKSTRSESPTLDLMPINDDSLILPQRTPRNTDLPWAFRISVLTCALIWGGFCLNFIYLIADDEALSVSTEKNTISSLNMNDFFYVLLTFATTFILNYVFLKRFCDYRAKIGPEKAENLRNTLKFGLFVSVLSIIGTSGTSVMVCGDSGGLWMLDFLLLFVLEIGFSQLMLKMRSKAMLNNPYRADVR